MIRIAFRYGDTRLFARLVCLFQSGDSAHCEVVVGRVGDDYECIGSSFLDGGVRTKMIPLPADKWRMYEVPGDAGTARAWLSVHEGQGYDWLGLFGFVVTRRIKGFARRWICTEVVADIMGLPDPWRYDLALLESVCQRMGTRVQ